MSGEIEHWIEHALQSLDLTGRKIDDESATRIRSEIEARFVEGSPRVWWLGLGCIHTNASSVSTRLSSLVSDPHAIGWFIPEIESEGSAAYRLSASEAEGVVRECPFFEYYFLDGQGRGLIAETDHNQFVVAGPLVDSLPPAAHG